MKEIAWTQSHIATAPLTKLMGLITFIKAEEVTSELNEKEALGYIENSAEELDNIIIQIKPTQQIK